MQVVQEICRLSTALPVGPTTSHKFFTALREAFRRYPQAKWFFLIDDDTYVSAHNLMRVLAPLDHSSVFYGGGTMFFNGCGVRLIGSGPRFCHGG
jgi:hypothetical protein